MIDYEKLQIAHEIGEKNDVSIYYAYKYKNGEFIYWVSLDQLHFEMKELNVQQKPQPKYKVGQNVYRLDGANKPRLFNIDKFKCEFGEYFYRDFDDIWWNESQLYPTREALILAQIEYWNSLGDTQDNQVQPDCKHVSKFNVINERGNINVTCYDCHKVLSEECKHDYKRGICIKCGHESLLGNQCKIKCIHESDGKHGLLTDPFQYQFQYQCIKCGEFYR